MLNYFSEQTVEKVDNILEKWNKKVVEKKNVLDIYNNLINKIDNKLSELSSEKIKVLLLYIKEIVINYKEKYLSSLETKIEEPKVEVEKEEPSYNILENIDFDVIKRNNIIVPIEWKKYAVLWFYFKSLYGDSSLHSLVLKNEFWNEADFLVKKLYLINRNREILAEWKLVNWVVYFDLKKTYLLKRDFNTSFYVAVELNNISDVNQTNKRIKFSILKDYSTFKTLVISNINGFETDYYISSSFNSNTYYIRKSKPIIENISYRWKLNVWTNKIYSLNLSSTWADTKISKLVLKTNISLKAEVDTQDVQIYIDNSLFKNCKAYFEDVNWNTKLHIDFNYPYGIWEWKKLDIYANFTKARDNSYIYTRLEQVSNEDSIVAWTYTWDYSILWSDDALKSNVSLDSNDYFTDYLVNFDNIRDWYLKN